MAKKLTPEQELEFVKITSVFSSPASEEAFCWNLSEKWDNSLRLSPELQAFFGQEISNILFRR